MIVAEEHLHISELIKNSKYKVATFMLLALFLLCYNYALSSSLYLSSSTYLSCSSCSSYSTCSAESDTLTIIADAGFPPFEFTDEMGNAAGFNIDLTKTLMKHLGITEYVIKTMPWAQALDDYDSNKNTLLTGMIYTRRRSEKYTFGPTHNNLKLNIIYRKGTKAIKTLAEAANKRIMVEVNSAAQEELSNIGLEKQLIPVQDPGIGLTKLSRGENDAVICIREVAYYYIKKYNLNNLVMQDMGMPAQAYCYVGKDSILLKELDSALVLMRADGSYQKLANTWYKNQDEVHEIKYPIYWFIGALLLALFLFVSVLVLKAIISKTKQELDKKSNRLALALKAGEVTVWGYDVKSNKFFNVECDYFPPAGQPFDKEVLFFHPDDRQLFIDTIKSLCNGGKPPKRLCFRLNHDNSGNWQYTEKEFVPLKDKNGKVVTIIGTHRNVTSVHDMQQRLKELVRRSDYAIKAADLTLWELNTEDMCFTTYNDPVTNYNDGLKTPMNDYMELMRAKDIKDLDITMNTLRSGTAVNVSCNEKFWSSIDRKWHYGIVTGTPFNIDKDGHTRKFVGFRKDVTELIETQENLKNEMKKAQQADKLKSAFVANMSHEIRTPLNAIVGFSNLLPKETDPEAKKEYVKLINTSSDMLLRLINDILDLSKIEAGIIEMADEKFDMSLCFNRTIASLKKMEHKEVPVSAINPYTKCIVMSDKNRISQIIVNFITNAIKYTPSGNISATYTYEECGIKITVKDTGIGIPADKQQLIFQRFEKLDDFAQGTGLGLSICKAITDNCGGKIGFRSEYKKGSTFWAWIPCQLKEPIVFSS
jgi:signal transduction histidine kinase/ABC-type amino acid transport substrate-binding protein